MADDVSDKRAQAAAFLTELVGNPRVREGTLDAILALRDAQAGTLVLRLPRASSKPVDGSLIQGGLTFRLSEEREI